MLIPGGCHCGNITFQLRWDPDPTEIPARACGCTFCAKHGAVWTSNPAGALEVSIKDPALVSRYEFGTHTALFHICGRCGVPPLVTCEIEGLVYAVVNVNTLQDVAPSLFKHAPVSFDGEEVDSRLARRRRNWIASVHFAESGR